jgi:5-methylcytosine-specific restriction endonuclease McrA
VGDRNCSVEQCDRKPYGHGLCQMHYKRMRARGTTDARVFVPKVCKVEGCERRANVPGSARGWCGPHYQRWQRWGDPLGEYAPLIGIAPCAIDGCDDLVKARGWCSRHWDRWSRHGHPTARLRGEVVNGCRICPRCGVDTPIADYSPGQAYCKTCCAAKAAAYRSINPPAPVDGWAARCEHCAMDFTANKRRWRYCSKECSAARKDFDNWKHQALRRARMRAAVVEIFDRREIFERDGWICQLCLAPVDPTAPRHSPRVPSIDHIIPISRGGDHSRANAQTACLGCNVRKGVRMA